MKLESAQRLKDRLLFNCQIMDWDENIVQFLDEEESIQGVEASGYKILISYKGISLKEKICIERTLQSLEFSSHFYAELGVEVAQRLIEQKRLGLTDDRPPDSHTLPLTAG